MQTKQATFWTGDFGKEYTTRNTHSAQDWDDFYVSQWGITKMEMNKDFLDDLSRDIKILEVGCNTGMQLNGLQRAGFNNLFGIELQPFAVAEAKKNTHEISILCASGFDLPFKDKYFDLVCTNGVLIHIAPSDLHKIMSEMYRSSRKYIWGFEYYSDTLTEINYRGNTNCLWKADYCDMFLKAFSDLRLVKKNLFPYLDNPEQKDCMYLLEKI